MNSSVQRSLLSMTPTTNQLPSVNEQLLSSLHQNAENGMNERLSSALFIALDDIKSTSISEGQMKVVKRTHSKTEIASSALQCDVNCNDSFFMLQKKKKPYMDSCKVIFNGPQTALVSMAFPESSFQTYERLRLGKAHRRSSLVRSSPLPQADSIFSEQDGIFKTRPLVVDGDRVSVSSVETRRSRIAAVLEEAAAVGLAVEELTSASYGKPTNAGFTEQGTTSKEFRDVKVPSSTTVSSIRYRPERRNSFVIHRKRPGSSILTDIPPSCPTFPQPAENPLPGKFLPEPEPSHREGVLSSHLSSEDLLTSSHSKRAESNISSNDSDLVNRTVEKDRWSATLSDTNSKTNSDVAENVLTELSHPVLMDMLQTFSQCSDVPTLTKEAKDYYGYE
jgi:hypothetical protein